MHARQSIVTTCTRDCPGACGLIAEVEDGRLVKLRGNPDHPVTQGSACGKASTYVDRVYHPERVTRPLVRASRDHDWKAADWDALLDLVAGKLKHFVNDSGPESILYYQGYGERTALKLLNRYFFNLLGGVTTLRGTLCSGAGIAAQNMDLGERISHDPLDHYNSASCVLWGRNPVSTQHPLLPILQDIRKRGGRILCVDPARTRTAAMSDRHIQPRPGGDGFLALAAAKRILAASAGDREFLDNCCENADSYLALLDRWSEPELAGLAGVSREDIASLAETLLDQKPTSILLGWGLHRREHAHLSIRAIDALAAVSGNIGVAGGGVSQGFDEYGPYDPAWWGDQINPPRRTLLMPRIGQEILDAAEPPIRMIYVTAANPVCMAPNTHLTRRAFHHAEFVVYSGHFLDDTAQCAHVFLPATTFLEELDVVASYGHNYAGPVNPAIAPVGECRPEFRMFRDLARRFDFSERLQRSETEWLRDICEPLWRQGATPKTLREGPFRLNAPMVPYADRVFPTSSGKFRLLPDLDPSLLESDDSDYPYTLLTAAPHDYLCSERTLSDHPDLPLVRLHPGEAARCGVKDGETVTVRSRVGEITARLRTDASLRRDVLQAERGGWLQAGHGLNRLTRDIASHVGEGTPYYETRVKALAK